MNDKTDDDLRSRFAQLRSMDGTDAPDFHELLHRAVPVETRRNGLRRLSRVAIPIAVAAAVVVAAGITRVARRRASVQVPLSAWTSPTASLLHTPGIGLSAPPDILTSVLDPAMSPSLFHKGTTR